MRQAELKAWRNGLLRELLLVVPTDGTWEELWARIEPRLEETKSSAVGRNAQVTIDFGMRIVSLPDLETLIERLRTRYGLLTVAVVGTETVTQEAGRSLGLNTYLMLPGSAEEGGAEVVANGSNALYIPSTVRSGQRIVHGGNIIVMGDVNAGAEVVAEGDILIFGTLRGLAHAGSQGDEKARIIAGVMRPQQLRIASRLARSPEEEGRPASGPRIPEVARIEDGEIQVFPV